MTDERFLTTEEVSKILSVSHKTLELWRRLGKGPPWHKLGRTVRYKESELSEWVRNQRQDGAAH